MEGDFRSLHLVSEDLLPMLRQLSTRDRSLSLEDQRRGTLAMLADTMRPHDGVRRSERFIPGPAGDIRVLVYEPEGAAGPTAGLLHIHGGGFVVGAPELGDERNSKLVAELGMTVVSVAYRLAPEAQYPAAVEDCYAGLQWLHANAADLNVDTARIGIIGESAGGGHAAALGLLARDRGEVPVAFQALIYPMLDDRTGSTVAPHPYSGEFVWTAPDNVRGWSAMLGQDAGGVPPGPYAVPGRHEDLAGLPPTLIQTAALDLFCEEDIDYARQLMRAGVPCELHVYPGATHGFTLVPNAASAVAQLRDLFDALKRALG